MKFSEIEDVMYLARVNLYWWDEENNYHDWREAKVKKIEDNKITLDVSADENVRYDEIEYTIEGLADFCHCLCEKHFEAIREYSAREYLA